jgi:hypothetical protein
MPSPALDSLDGTTMAGNTLIEPFALGNGTFSDLLATGGRDDDFGALERALLDTYGDIEPFAADGTLRDMLATARTGDTSALRDLEKLLADAKPPPAAVAAAHKLGPRQRAQPRPHIVSCTDTASALANDTSFGGTFAELAQDSQGSQSLTDNLARLLSMHSTGDFDDDDDDDFSPQPSPKQAALSAGRAKSRVVFKEEPSEHAELDGAAGTVKSRQTSSKLSETAGNTTIGGGETIGVFSDFGATATLGETGMFRAVQRDLETTKSSAGGRLDGTVGVFSDFGDSPGANDLDETHGLFNGVHQQLQ